MKKLFCFCAMIFCLCACSRERLITSIEGTYRLAFNEAADCWELNLREDGHGSLKYREGWESPERKGALSFLTDCNDFTYIVDRDGIEFSKCSIGFWYTNIDKNTFGYGTREKVQVALKWGTIDWGIIGRKGYPTELSIHVTAIVNGEDVSESPYYSPWDHPYAILCEAE